MKLSLQKQCAVLFAALIIFSITCLKGQSSKEFSYFVSHVKETYISQTTADFLHCKQQERSIERELQEDINGFKARSGYLVVDADQAKQIEQAFDEKSKELIQQYGSVSWKKRASQVAFVLGGVFLLGALSSKDQEKIALGIIGTVCAATGGAGWYHCNKTIDVLPDHIKAMHVMGEKWSNSFDINNN